MAEHKESWNCVSMGYGTVVVYTYVSSSRGFSDAYQLTLTTLSYSSGV